MQQRMGQKITGSDQSHKFGDEKKPPVKQNLVAGKPICPDSAVRYLYQPGEQEGGQRRATDLIWSVNIHKISHHIVLHGIRVYYLMPPSSAERFRDGRTAYCSCRYPNAYVVIPSGAIHRLVSSGESVVLLIVRP